MKPARISADERRKRNRELKRAKWAAMSEEERAAANAHRRANRAPRTEKERRADNAHKRRKYYAMTDEQKAKEALRVRQLNRKRQGIINPPAENRSGECPICLRDSALVVDHNHSTGLMRGWLCRTCNAGLGMFVDQTDNLLRAVEYLARTRMLRAV